MDKWELLDENLRQSICEDFLQGWSLENIAHEFKLEEKDLEIWFCNDNPTNPGQAIRHMAGGDFLITVEISGWWVIWKEKIAIDAKEYIKRHNLQPWLSVCETRLL